MATRIRPAHRDDEPFLLDMLYEALFIPPGHAPFPRSVLTDPRVRHYADGFGTRSGDVGFVAEHDGEAVGAAWARRFDDDDHGYGWIDAKTPELTVAVRPVWRRRGVGTALLAALAAATPRLSLSVDRRNPAVALYRSLGFVTVCEHGNSLTMLRDSPAQVDHEGGVSERPDRP